MLSRCCRRTEEVLHVDAVQNSGGPAVDVTSECTPRPPYIELLSLLGPVGCWCDGDKYAEASEVWTALAQLLFSQ